MAWGYRASSYADDGTGYSVLDANSTTVTLGTAISAGDAVVLSMTALPTTGTGASPTFSVSDSVNGAWGSRELSTVTWAIGALNARTSAWVFENSGAGTPVVTVTITGTTSITYQGGMQVAAFSGIATATPKDASAAATGTGTSPTTGAVSPATGAANELMVGIYMDQGEGTTLTAGLLNGISPTGSFKHDADSGKWQGLLEYGDSGSSGGTPSATFTTTGAPSGWGVNAIVLKITGGAPVIPPGLGPVVGMPEPHMMPIGW